MILLRNRGYPKGRKSPGPCRSPGPVREKKGGLSPLFGGAYLLLLIGYQFGRESVAGSLVKCVWLEPLAVIL